MTYPSTLKYVLISKETTWNTEVAPAKDTGMIISDVSVPSTREVIESKGISKRDTQQITGGIYDPGVNISGDYQHARLFEYIIGSVGHVETTGDWTHTFTISNDPPSASIEAGNNGTSDVEFTASGCLIESAELSIALNENLKLSTVWKGGTPLSSTTGSAAVLSTLPVFPHALVSATINAVSYDEVQEAKIAFNGTVSRSGGLSSNIYQQGHGTDLSLEYTAKIGIPIGDNSVHNLFINGTTHEFILAADNQVALGSGKRAITVTLENCLISSFDEVTTVGELTFVEITGIGTFKTMTSVDNISDVNFS